MGENHKSLHESTHYFGLKLMWGEWKLVANKADERLEMCWVASVHRLGGKLTVVCVYEMRCFRGVVDELDLADLPHFGTLVTDLLQYAERDTQKRQTFPLHGESRWAYTQHKWQDWEFIRLPLTVKTLLVQYIIVIGAVVPLIKTFSHYLGVLSAVHWTSFL